MKTSEFPQLGYRFEEFNPFQESFIPFRDKDVNVACAAGTGCGKSVIAELTYLYEIVEKGGIGLFLAPMRALAQEKFDDWTSENSPFKKFNPCILTGDYKLTPKKKKELQESSLIVMTSEMLDSRSRRMNKEGNDWLLKAKVLVVDETHMIGMCNDGADPIQERGHKLEAALLRFSKLNKDCRIIFLSATLPNIRQLADWMTVLNGKQTHVVESDYRPQPLVWHFEHHIEKIGYGSYWFNRDKMLEKAVEVIKQYPNDMWLVFCHSKNDGREIQRKLSFELESDVEFHSADLDKNGRLELEQSFRKRGSKILIATSTLAYGVNLPARRVMILGSRRGLNDVHPYDIKQMGGRAGRPGLDPMGDVHWVIGVDSGRKAMDSIEHLPEAKSQMSVVDVLAFHIIAEMAEGGISTIEDVKKYYERCLAKFQGTEISDFVLMDLMKVLTEQKAIKLVEGKYVVTNLGKIASWLYFSPFDVCDWWKNFSKLFNGGIMNYEQISDADIAVAWASTRSNQLSYIPKDIGEGCDELRRTLCKMYLKDTSAAASTALFLKLKGIEIADIPSSLIPMYRGLSFDVERHAQAILLINSMYGCWNQDKVIKMIATRIAYGVGWKQAELCLLPKIGKARSAKLVQNGIVTLRDFIDKKTIAKEIIGEAIYTVALERALELTGQIGKIKV